MIRRSFRKIIRVYYPTVTHYLFHYFFTLLIIPPGLLLSLIQIPELTNLLLAFWARMLFWSMGRRVRVKNRNYIKPGHTYLALINHSSLFDIPAIMTILPGGAWIGRGKLLKIPLFGRYLSKLNYIPIEPSNWRKSLEALEAASMKSSRGQVILMFPEGTRSPDGNLQEFRRGFIRILRKTEIDILPITINGLYNLKPKYQRHIDTSEKLEIIINKPLPASELILLDDKDIIQKVKQRISRDHNNIDN